MVAHMPTRISLLWTVVLLTLPCPLFLVLPRGSAARCRAGPERQPDRAGGLTGTGGRGAHDRRGRDHSRRWALGGLVPGAPTPPQARAIGIAALVVLSLLPIYFLDCMDGHGLTRCSLPMIVRAGLTAGRQCGDLDW